MGFQHFKPVVLKAATAKGGRVKKPKGLAKLSPERRKEIAAMGGNASAKNRSSKGAKQIEVNRGDNSQRLADILGTLNE